MKIFFSTLGGSRRLPVCILIFLMSACAKKEISYPDTHQIVASAVPSLSEALLAMQCYNNAFYHQYGTYGPSFKAYYYSDFNHNGRMDFWRQAEAIETIIDA